MASFLKGNTTSFIFDKYDNEKLVQLLFEGDLVLYKHTVDDIFKQLPIHTLNSSFDIDYLHYFVVPKTETHLVKWRTVKLAKGGENFPLDNLNSRAIQLQLSRQSHNRIDTGRIAITTQWEDDLGNIKQATFEKDVYKMLQGLIRKLSVGKIGGVFVGEEAYRLWEADQVELCQIIQGTFTYKKDDFKKKGKK
ncbi:hypothetical protein [Litchfieldia salsa]|uniref:Uncharacterized protein n=1 Tax=Litchfieldia salsa TaxID=930152 RepID=A0A1H0X065_9BACI|nr:hypothetical protein [Litchfieldia salsa]SDP96239.1 hypothetical protein SAMN05216565_1212 [Litchfieldia salsa]